MSSDTQDDAPAAGGIGGAAAAGTGGAPAVGGEAGQGGAGVSASGAGGSEWICEGPGFPRPEPISFSSSRVALEEDGTPVGDLLVTLCGLDSCNLAVFDPASGYYVATSPIPTDMTAPTLETGDGKIYVQMGFPIRDSTTDFGVVELVRLPAEGTGADLAAGSDAESGTVVLSLVAGTELTMDNFVYDTAEAKQFRAVVFEPSRLPTHTEAPTLDIVIGTTPRARFCPPAALTVPNSLEWPPDTPVEIHHQGVEIDQEWAPYGGWAQIATATVTSDGASIVTDADSGIPELGLLGLRRAD